MYKRIICISVVLFFASLAVLCHSAECRRTKPKETISVQGLDLFFSVAGSEKASLQLLTKDDNILDTPRKIPGELEELHNIIHNPVQDKAVILERQEVIRTLAADMDMEQISSYQSDIRALLKAMELIFLGSKDADSGEKRGLAWLMDGRNLTQEDIARGIEAVKAKVEEFKRRDSYGEPALSEGEKIYWSLGLLGSCQDSLKKFITAFSSSNNPHIRLMAERLKEDSEALRALGDWQDLFEAFRSNNTDKKGALSKDAINLGKTIDKIGAILMIARYASNGKYHAATYDIDKPVSYEKGHNFAGKPFDEVSNDSTADVPCVVLTGSNMSGKSYNLVQDLFIQLLGQSFGWVPAENANLRIYKNIVYIDRADTEATQNLSAFGSEISGKWMKLVSVADDSTLALVDEGFSTTSPEDQEALLYAATTVLIKRGAHLKIATHSENFIERAQDDPDFRFYHFDIKISESDLKDVEFNYTLSPGMGDSQAIAIAAKQGLDEAVLSSAQGYLDNSITPLVQNQIQSPQPVPVTAYNEEERTRLMRRVGSFINILPNGNELIIKSNPQGKNGKELRWRYITGSYETRKDESYHSNLHDEPLLKLFSDDSDFSRWSGMADVKYEGIDEDRLMQIVDLLTSGTTSSSQELLERQKMFDLLSQDGEAEEIFGLLKRMGNVLNLFANTEFLAKHLEDFNRFLLEDAGRSVQGWTEYKEGFAVKIEGFLKVIDFNAQLLGLDLEALGLKEKIDRFKRLVAIAEEYQAASEKLTKAGYTKEAQTEYKEKNFALNQEFAALIGGSFTGDKESPWSTQVLNSEGKRVYIGSIEETQKAAQKLFEAIDPHIRAVSLFDLDIEKAKTIAHELTQYFGELVTKSRAGPLQYFNAMRIIDILLTESDVRKELLDKLSGYDSVHLQQFGRYFGQLFNFHFGDIKSPNELWNKLKKRHEAIASLDERKQRLLSDVEDDTYRRIYCEKLIQELDTKIAREKESIKYCEGVIKEGNNDWMQETLTKHEKELVRLEGLKLRYQASDISAVREYINTALEEERKKIIADVPEFYEGHTASIGEELSKLYTLATMGKIIRDYGFCKVEFNDRGIIDVQDGWSLSKAENEQVKNDIHLDPANRINLISGSNMSGKTFYEKMLIWVVLSAQATGFAPAESASLPIFNNIVYLDRVNQKMDMNLSAYGNEVEYWKKLLGVLGQPNTFVIGCLDELGSTTSPDYQSALSYAIAERILQSGNYALIASHNHDFIDTFSSTYPGYTFVGHLDNRIENGEVIFEYLFTEGHQDSNAIEVARTLGFDEEILQLAEKIKQETESKP